MSLTAELAPTAAKWAVAMNALADDERRIADAQRVRDKRAEEAKLISDELRKCVGKNISRRVFQVSRTQVVIVQWISDTRTDVALAEMEPTP